MNNWFEVSKEGLRELQEGKPKHFIARELIQNCWDEQTRVCQFNAFWNKGIARVTVLDDNPAGFKNLSDAFTLFQKTAKRGDPSKRGRFNIGEKQVLSLCNEAKIKTTKGTIIFDKTGRRTSRIKSESGSRITISFKTNKSDFDEMLSVVKKYLVPQNIDFFVNGEKVSYRKPYKIITATLLTENEVNGIFKRVQRKTDIHILKTDDKPMLYEMGLPVTNIDCQFDIDVQQKVPLAIDRDTVPVPYLKALFAEVLNATYEDVNSENSSEVWIRQAVGDKRIGREAVKEIVKKRFGDKVVVANPFDPNSIDEAISNKYNVVYGSEMSKEEWENIRRAEAISSSTDLFGKKGVADWEHYPPTPEMEKVAALAKKIAKRVLGINLKVKFVKSPDTYEAADFGYNTLTFNVSKLGKKFFDRIVSEEIIELILHELGHHAGHHTEMSYHKLLTRMAGQLVMIALDEPDFFKINY
jgi:hypothetical protein